MCEGGFVKADSAVLCWVQVLERANNTEYGLAAGVVSNDENSINTLSRGLRAGTIWVNTWNQVRQVLWDWRAFSLQLICQLQCLTVLLDASLMWACPLADTRLPELGVNTARRCCRTTPRYLVPHESC